MNLLSTENRLREQAAAYASLVRLPNLFTAPPDVLLGAVLVGFGVGSSGVAVPIEHVGSLAVVSMLLYGAGTTLNDYADLPVDAVERPERPLPSHAVSPQTALSFGIGLLIVAIAAASVLVNPAAMVVTVLLGGIILLYDFALKGTPLGFAAMGLSRGLNVVLGMTALGRPDLSATLFFVPLVIAGYIASVTWMAADETTGGTRHRILITQAMTGVVSLTVVVLGILLDVRLVSLGAAVMLVFGFLLVTNRQLRIAYNSQTPAAMGTAVGTCVLWLVVVDTAIIALFTLRVAALTSGFFLAAKLLSVRFDIS
jgi:4-hydroxybenzoate polyprenyltransferase